MAILLQLQITDIDRREINLKKELEKVDRKTTLLMNKKLEFDRLKRKVELYNDMTALLERKNQEALIRKAEKPEEITIVKPALLPTSPMNPPKTATIKKTRYAYLVGTYTSPDELERQILSLKKLGNSPYFIKDHNGKTRLFVGAFLTRAGAERQYHELKSSGIENKVVKR